MCRISYETCVCFIFLVILAVLSCSGFRIDNLAMTDISKRNSSGPSGWGGGVADAARHRIRHHRQLRVQAHTPRALPPAPQPSEPIPSRLHDPPARSVARSQRSNDHQRRRQRVCPEYDVSWKAFKADAVVVAKVESVSSRCRDVCPVFFKVKQTIKSSSSAMDERLRLKFDKRSTGCEYDDLHRSQSLVRANINEAKEYILFLDANGAHNFTAAFAPEVVKKKKLGVVLKVVAPTFRPRSVSIERHSQRGGLDSKPLRLSCKVRGFPIPVIYWKRNNSILHPNSRQRITQKKRRSTLMIRNFSEADVGRYECVARGVDGKENSHAFQFNSTAGERPSKRPNERPTVDRNISTYDKVPCPDERMKKDFCHNGGTCFYIQTIGEYGCVCPGDFSGTNCAEKLTEVSSMYRQTPIYTCKVGLFTKYDNC